jgi:hypothetical protein
MSSNKNQQRQSQLVSTFGPGSMVDLPTRSVIIAGLDDWHMPANSFRSISEPRLIARLEKLLRAQGRLGPTQHLSLRTPPLDDGNANGRPASVPAPVFPTWFVCDRAELAPAGQPAARRRRLVHWRELDTRGRRKFTFDDGTSCSVTPIRFVGACQQGHMQDIEWRRVVHGASVCQEPMWLEERGTSADPADTTIVCGCGGQLSLQDAFQPGRLGRCGAKRPWLLDVDPDGCGENLKLLTRTATNTYFPQVLTVIALPAEDDELTRLVGEALGELTNVTSPAAVGLAKQFNPRIAASLGGYPDEDIFAALERVRDGAQSTIGHSAKLAEFEVFASSRPEIGRNDPDAKLHAATLPRAQWANPNVSIDLSAIKNLVLVHRLREVACLYGFTRFEAAPTQADGDIEDVQLAVRGAPLSRDTDWLPAVEQFGEGIFLHLDERAIHRWLAKPEVQARERKLKESCERWSRRHSGGRVRYPSTPYLLLHSLAHALMTEIALECGYPASSLKERVYTLAAPGSVGPVDRCGILIYTASAGAQGTLGGLVGAAPRFASILRAALERAAICSNDPVCADHEPSDHSGDRATHGAACHGCLLIAETSCEMRNLFLDRALLVPTMAGLGAEFF